MHEDLSVKGLDDLNALYFTIGTKTGLMPENEKIPRNYFCSWSVQLDRRRGYMIQIVRSDQVNEDLNLMISGKVRQELVSYTEFLEAERYYNTGGKVALFDATHLQIFARNVFPSSGNTFLIKIEQIQDKGFKLDLLIRLAIVFSSLFCCLLLSSCCLCAMRRRSNHPRHLVNRTVILRA